MLRHFSNILTAEDAPNPSVDFNGVWVNELGSEMTLTVGVNGRVTGLYKTGVGAPGQEEEFDLSGFATDDLLSFTVNFGNYGSLTSWAGQHTIEKSGGEVIKTLWLLAKNVKDDEEPKNLWGAILTGANFFTRKEKS